MFSDEETFLQQLSCHRDNVRWGMGLKDVLRSIVVPFPPPPNPLYHSIYSLRELYRRISTA